MQEATEKQASELAMARSRVADLQGRLKDSEDAINSSKLEIIKYQDQISKLQRDLKEVSCYIFIVLV